MEKNFKQSKFSFVKKHARGLAVLFVYLVMIGIIYLILRILFPLLISNTIEFIEFIPNLLLEIEAFIANQEWGSLNAVANIREEIALFITEFDSTMMIDAIGSITNFALSTVLLIFDFVLALIISIYILLYKHVIFQTINRIINIFIKKESLDFLKHYGKQADDLFYKFIKAQFLDACIMGGLSILLLLVLNVRFAVFLGILLGVANMIPKFGSIIASIVVIILTFITGDVNQGIWTAILVTALQQIDGNIIGPMIMGDALKINPILVFFALIVGAAYFGIIGMFISIPVMALIKIIFINVIEVLENKKIDTNL